MDVVGARRHLLLGIFSVVEAWSGWVGVGAGSGDRGGDLGAGSGEPQGAGPEADSSRGWSPDSTLRSSPASLWPCVSSPGGSRHHDPKEQVEKIRWQHHFDQLHPQTGRRRAPGGSRGAGWAGSGARGAGVRGRSADPTCWRGGPPLCALFFPALSGAPASSFSRRPTVPKASGPGVSALP